MKYLLQGMDGMILTAENHSTWSRTCPGAVLTATIPMCIVLWSKIMMWEEAP